jgi:hypothetical protein
MYVSEKSTKHRAIVIGAARLLVYSLGRFFAELVGKSISMNAHRFKEDVLEGIERMPEAFLRLLHGKNFGKALMKSANNELTTARNTPIRSSRQARTMRPCAGPRRSRRLPARAWPSTFAAIATMR